MKLGLGTVQLGLDYGIANKLGKPDRNTALGMLKYAYANGIFFFDTASAYGDSEKLIGDFIAASDIKDVKISTKGLAGYDILMSGDDANFETQAINEVEKSLENLKSKSIAYYLLHSCKTLAENGVDAAKAFGKLKKRGMIGKFGVSVYSPADIRLCLEHDIIDVIQLPFNILDTRLVKTGLFKELKRRGIEIHARSIYLQGALLMDSKNSDAKIPGLGSYAEKLRIFAEKMNLTVKQLAFLFVRGNEYIDGMIVGCESPGQLEENIKLFGMDAIDTELVSNFVDTEFDGIVEEILNPALWKR